MDIWKLLTGVVLFLMGTGFMEDALRHAMSRKFKLFLKDQTRNRFKAVTGGTVLTVFMQSSSVVNMLVLSLVGAGIIQLYQALAVMMGANIGTTFTGWLLVALGFYFDIKDFALPLLSVSGILMLTVNRNSVMYHAARFFTGFAFLFLGLAYIREGVEVMIQNTTLASYAAYPNVFFALLGLVLTAMVQSSSVMMALVLSVLHHKGIDITSGAAIMLGAEIGTTLKLGLASVGGLAAKKRVAFGNIIFNTVSGVLIFFFIPQLIAMIGFIPGFSDPLLQLVGFQTLVNLISVIVFLPILKPFSRFLERRFHAGSSMDYLNRIPSNNISLAIDALEKEYYHLLAHTLYFMKTVFGLKDTTQELSKYPAGHKWADGVRYEEVKSLYGEVHGYYIRIRQEEMSKAEAMRIDAILSGMRNLMYASKSIKDIVRDLDQLSRSSNDVKYRYYLSLQQEAHNFYEASLRIVNANQDGQLYDSLVALHSYIQGLYSSGIRLLNESAGAVRLNATELATLVNVHREIMTGFKSVIFSMKEFFLTGKEADYFDDLPGFIR